VRSQRALQAAGRALGAFHPQAPLISVEAAELKPSKKSAEDMGSL